MDESGVIQDMKKITLENNIFTLRNIVTKNTSQEYPTKSEGHKYNWSMFRTHKGQT